MIKEIEVGQIVYHTDTGEKCEVIAVVDHPRLGPLVAVEIAHGGRADFTPEAFWKYFTEKKVRHANS